MQPADDIKRLIDESKITSSAQVDRRILADALADLENRRTSMQPLGPACGESLCTARQPNWPPQRQLS